MDAAGVSGIASSFYTYCIAVLIAGVFCIKYWRGLFKLPLSIVWLGVVAGWTNLSYVLAVIDGEVMRVMLLFYLSPLWTLILAHFWLKEQTHFVGYIAIVISLIGAFVMLYDPNISPLPLPQNNAEWLGLSAGMGFSLTNVMTRRATYLSLRAKSFAVWIGVIGMALFMMQVSKLFDMHTPLPTVSFFSVTQWLMMSAIALLLIAATVLVQYGVTKVTATRASVLFLFELIVAAIAAYYLANEIMQINDLIGGSLIVIAGLLANFGHQQKAE